MPARYGIDTSVLMRLVTGDPDAGFRQVVSRLTERLERKQAEIFASNQVIGEAYVALQHHYGASRLEARNGLISVLTSGLVAPLHREAALDALRARTGCGLLDRLIAQEYRQLGMITLTLDRKMAALPDVQHL